MYFITELIQEIRNAQWRSYFKARRFVCKKKNKNPSDNYQVNIENT